MSKQAFTGSQRSEMRRAYYAPLDVENTIEALRELKRRVRVFMDKYGATRNEIMDAITYEEDHRECERNAK